MGWFLRLKIEISWNSSPQSSDMKLTGFFDCVNFKENVLKKREENKTNSNLNQGTNSFNIDSITLLKQIRNLLKAFE